MKLFKSVMNILKYFPVLLFAFSTTIYGQGYLNYHKSIASAEELLVKGDYKASLSIYDSLFKEYDFSFSKDCYLAAQIAGYINADNQCYHFLIKGFQCGLPENCLLLNAILKQWRDRNPALNFTTTDIDSFHKIYLSNIQLPVREKLQMMFNEDQIKMKQSKLNIYNEHGILKDELFPFWDSLYREIKKMTSEYGFPAEKIAGCDSSKTYKVVTKNLSAYFILIHYRNIEKEFLKQMESEIDKGNITPEEYGALSDNCVSKRDFNTMQFFSLQSCEAELKINYCKKCMENRIDNINNNRASIGLPSYECQVTKENLQVKYNKAIRNNAAINEPAFDFNIMNR